MQLSSKQIDGCFLMLETLWSSTDAVDGKSDLDGKDKEEKEVIGSRVDEEEVMDEDGLAAESSMESDGLEGSASKKDNDIDK
jgi:hypothetical protein